MLLAGLTGEVFYKRIAIGFASELGRHDPGDTSHLCSKDAKKTVTVTLSRIVQFLILRWSIGEGARRVYMSFGLMDVCGRG